MEVISKAKLRRAMLQKAVGVNQLSQAAGITQSAVCKFLRQDFSACRLPTISKIARALKVAPEELILEEKEGA